MTDELISVIVPVYKVEDYLERCIDSILQQTYTCLEIILVDDGSPDRCPEICDIYAAKDSRIQVIHKENGGLSSARNAGINISTGSYIAFVDSDDYIHPQMYEILIKNIKKYNADISVGDIQWIYNDLEVIQEGENRVRLYTGKEAVWNIFDKKLYVPSVVAWNKLYKSSLFSDVRYPEGKIHEDEFTTYRLFWKCVRVVYSEKKLYYYVQRTGSIMNQKWREASLDGLEAMESMMSFLIHESERKLYDEARYRYLCMLKVHLKRIQDEGENSIEESLWKRFCFEYDKGNKQYSLKRKIRLGLFYYLKINI